MYKLPAIFFVVLLPLFAFPQRTISGRVVNNADGQPIAGSSVFINNSSKGTISNKDGQFELTDIPVGQYELIISSVGFETTVFSFNSEQLPLVLKIEMKIKVRELENVTVEPSVEEGWDRWGRMFTDNFIGNIPSASQCKIKNPKAIRFRYYRKSNRVTAFADEPLIIENKALGYKITYQLEDFEVNFKTNALVFAGYPFFEEMERNKKKWEKNREKAYYGSMMHFFRSLYRNELATDGYEVRRMKRVPNEEKERVRKIYEVAVAKHAKTGRPMTSVNILLDSAHRDSITYFEEVLRQKDYKEVYGTSLLTADSLIIKEEIGVKVLFFPDYLFITYKFEAEDRAYLSFHSERRQPSFQQSYIWLTRQTPVTIDAAGNYNPPQEIFTMAYWGWDEKMANMLPVDYVPGE